MRITIVSGARPNFMKIAPICRAIDAAREAGKNISYRIVYTGPQDDTSLDASLFSDLSMRKPDAYLGVTGHNHSQVAASIMLAFERELDGHPAQVVLVVDDMTATMSCSIVAKKRGLKVAHVIGCYFAFSSLYKRSCDYSYHIIQKSVSRNPDNYIRFILSPHIYRINRSYSRLRLCFYTAETLKIMLSYQPLCCTLHCIYIKRLFYMPAVISKLWNRKSCI